MSDTATRLRGYLTRIAAEYPGCWKQVDAMRAARGRDLPQWPGWCFMPLAGAFAVASGGGRIDEPMSLSAISALGALAAWRPTQGIYRFDPAVEEAVRDTPLTGEIPADVLHHIPEWCVYIETPDWVVDFEPSVGFFAFLEHDANDGREELRLSIDNGETLNGAMPIHLGKGSLLAGIESATAEAAKQARENASEEVAQQIQALPADILAEQLTPRINLLLYLCSMNAEMRQRDTGRLRPSKPTLTKTKDGMRMFPAEKPAIWDVGSRLGAALRHAQTAEPTRPHGEGTHARPRAHIRRAHWHSFWTGPRATPLVRGDRKLVLKWLPPLAVNVDEEHEVVPTVHPVKPGNA